MNSQLAQLVTPVLQPGFSIIMVIYFGGKKNKGRLVATLLLVSTGKIKTMDLELMPYSDYYLFLLEDMASGFFCARHLVYQSDAYLLALIRS